MSQVTWRVDDQLLDRVRRASRERGWSLNEYVTRVLDVATDPSRAGSSMERLRERLAAADLLEVGGLRRVAPAPAAVAEARRRAGEGTPLSDVVIADR